MKIRLSAIFLPISLGLMLVMVFIMISAGLPKSTMAAPNACVPGPHSGTLTANEEWCASDSNHLLTGDVTVPAGITLTVEAGSVVQGDRYVELRVEGHLEALGTASQPITFTSSADSGPEQWSGLAIDGGSGHLRYATVRYSGDRNSIIDSIGTPYQRSNITIRNGTLRLENAAVRDLVTGDINNYDYGLLVRDSQLVISDTIFTGIGDDRLAFYDFPVRLMGLNTTLEMSGCTFTGNTYNRVLLDNDAMMGQDATLALQNELDGYQIAADFTVPPAVILTVEPGVTIMTNWELHKNMIVQGHLDALGTASQPITFTSAADSGPGEWSGLVFDGGTGHLRYATVRFAGERNHIADADLGPWSRSSIAIGNVNTGEVRLENVNIRDMRATNDAVLSNQDIGIYVNNGNLVVENSLFTGIGSSVIDGYLDIPVYISGENSVVALNSNLFQENFGPVYIKDGGESSLQNNAIIDTQNGGLKLASGAQVNLLHTTIAHNTGNGIYIENGGAVTFTNTIVAGNDVGLQVDAGGAVTMIHTLWQNTTNIVGAVNETGHLDGFPAFAADGYHLTGYSAALEHGINAGVGDDIDGEVRPQPNGTTPDLGADEYIIALGDQILATKSAYPPQWVTALNPLTGLPFGYLRHQYLLTAYYGSLDPNPPDLTTVTMTDTLPAELDFETETHAPMMDFSQQGQTLVWQTQQPLAADQFVQVLLSTLVDPPEPGLKITNTAEMLIGGQHFDLQANTEVPLFPPLITTPGKGEICTSAGLNGTQVIGMAMGNAVVKLYENGSEVLTTTAQASGVFSVNYMSNRVGVDAQTSLTAVTCKPGDTSQCSEPSAAIILKPIQSFWCPQRSSWTVPPPSPYEGTYKFIDPDTGEYATQDWAIVGPHHFPESIISLVLPDPGGQPPKPYITVDDGDPIYPVNPPTLPPWVYNFPVPLRPYDLLFWNPLDPLNPSEGGRLIDPDGYIFDVNLGFDLNNPTSNVVEGVTVTCMVSMTEWGGWVPWPAQLYEDQINPQVTGEDGYFAFFTPPGHYYLQVESTEGYQPWRSPVVEVISEIVHVNVPYTPWSSGVIPQVSLADDGPEPAVITVSAGSAVEWVAAPDLPLHADEMIALLENPALRLLSDLDPLNFTDGWDGGMIAPGQIFRRHFTRPGAYNYSDGDGHTGQVIVTPYQIYLPATTR